MPNSIDERTRSRTKSIDLNDIECWNGLFRYRRCEHCGEQALQTVQRETTWAHDWFTKCLNCNAQIGYAYQIHTEIENRLLADGWTERQLYALRTAADHIAGGPYSLQYVLDEINAQAEAVAS